MRAERLDNFSYFKLHPTSRTSSQVKLTHAITYSLFIILTPNLGWTNSNLPLNKL